MARGQDAPISAGGQINPFVAESLQQNKQLASNRLVTAMQEKGATERAQISSSTQLASQKMQNQASLQMQAASLAEADKRAAEAEAEHREQRRYEKAQTESAQRFEAEQNKLMRDHESLIEQGRFDEAAKVRQAIKDSRDADRLVEAEQAKRMDNYLASMLRGSQMKATADEKLLTFSLDSAEQHKRETEVYNKVAQKTRDSLASDIGNIQWEETTEKSTPLPSRAGIISEEERQRSVLGGRFKAPLSTLQKKMAENKSNISLENLSSAGISNLEKQISEGSADFADVRNAVATLDSFISALEPEIPKMGGQKQKLAKATFERVSNMRDRLEGLKYSKTQIQGDPNRTVGKEVRLALGTKYPELATGGRMARYRELAAGNDQAFLNELSKGIEPISLMPVDLSMSPGLRKEIETHNAIIRSAYPEMFGGQETTETENNWGAR